MALRFAQICYFYEEEDGTKVFHGRWYTHGVFTMLQETAHPQELYLLDECDRIALDTVYQKVNLRILEPDESEPITQSGVYNDFFTR